MTMTITGTKPAPSEHPAGEEIRRKSLPVVEAPAVTPPRVRMTSSQLFTAGNTVVIHHEGADYRLRITSQNKLILTK